MAFDLRKARQISAKPDYFFDNIMVTDFENCSHEETHSILNITVLVEKSSMLSAALDRIEDLEKALILERANCIMAYEVSDSLPELDECAAEDRYRNEAREILKEEGLL